MALSHAEGPQRGQAKTSIPPPSRKRYGVPRRSLGGGGNVRRMRSAQRRASSRGGRRSRPQGGSGAGSVGLASRGSTRAPALGASAVVASPPSVAFPKPTTSDRHPSTWLGMVLSKVEGPRRPWPQYTMIQNEVDARPRDHPSTLLGMTLSLSKGQDGQPLQQFEGIEQEVRGAIRPRVPELQHHLPLGH